MDGGRRRENEIKVSLKRIKWRLTPNFEGGKRGTLERTIDDNEQTVERDDNKD